MASAESESEATDRPPRRRLRSCENADASLLVKSDLRFDFDDGSLNCTGHFDLVLDYTPAVGGSAPRTTPPVLVGAASPVIVHEGARSTRAKPGRDPLPDSLYACFHRRMRKDERAMVNAERVRVLLEIDTLKSLLDLLDKYTWEAHLPKICRIRDLTNLEEYERKRDLTIDHIKRLLHKNDDWRRRWHNLQAAIKAYENQAAEKCFKGESSLNQIKENEYLIPIKDLAERNQKQRIAQHGRPLYLDLHNGFVVVIDPYSPPQVVSKSSIRTAFADSEASRPVETMQSVDIKPETSEKLPYSLSRIIDGTTRISHDLHGLSIELMSLESLTHISMHNGNKRALGVAMEQSSRARRPFSIPGTIRRSRKRTKRF